MLLLVFEFLGTTELLVILVVALVVFGPRKLPELGRMLGKSLAEFKRQTDDFKRTWEREVELDKLTRDVAIDNEVREAREALDASYTSPALEPAGGGEPPDFELQTVARGARPDAETTPDAQALTSEEVPALADDADAVAEERDAAGGPVWPGDDAPPDERPSAAVGERDVAAEAGASKVS